jgi:hypothetical protein
MSKLLAKPWFFVVFAFLLLVAAWSSLLVVAVRFSRQNIPVEGVAKH